MSTVEFERAEIERLLRLLDGRLRARGVAASVYVVGGAAIAVTVYDARRTMDVDAVVSDRTVLDEARLLAESVGIPPTWLNENARPWVPPRPAEATVVPTRPGLTVHWAPPEHLLAMKLVAMRPQDALTSPRWLTSSVSVWILPHTLTCWNACTAAKAPSRRY